MPFRERSAMDQKREFVRLAVAEGANVSELCARFGIGRTCAYKLLKRHASSGEAGLSERSRRPHVSPGGSCRLTWAGEFISSRRHQAKAA